MLKPLGQLFQLLDAPPLGIEQERRLHCRLGLVLLILGQIAQDIANLVIAASLDRVVWSVHNINSTSQCFITVNDKQPWTIRFDAVFDQIVQ